MQDDQLILWDWYSSWKTNGLKSYQLRREYISALYEPVIAALEKPAPPEPPRLQDKSSFSVLRGYVAPESKAAITIREEAPAEMRRTIVGIMSQAELDYDDFFDVAAIIGKRIVGITRTTTVGHAIAVQLDQLFELVSIS